MQTSVLENGHRALKEIEQCLNASYDEGYNAGQLDLFESLKAYFPDMKCVADISLRIEALQAEVKPLQAEVGNGTT